MTKASKRSTVDYIINALPMSHQEKFSVEKLAKNLDQDHESLRVFLRESDEDILKLFEENPHLIDPEIQNLLEDTHEEIDHFDEASSH